jgi:molecular chaperone DnaJ
MKDFYKILEVSRHAKSDEIKKSYRRLAFKYHPDTNNGSKHLEAKFKQLAEAYETLSDPKERKVYDNDLKKPIGRSTNNSKQRNGPAKQQPLSPAIFLHFMKDITRQLSNFDKSSIDKVNLYDTLNQFLSDGNINFLLNWDDKKTNLQIINEVLNSCKPFGVEKHPTLGFIYVEQIAEKLARLAGNDRKTEQRIFKFAKQRKYVVFINEYQSFIAVSFLLMVIVLFIIIAKLINK